MTEPPLAPASGDVSRPVRLLALFPVLFLAGRVWDLARKTELVHVFWSCNVANATLAVGLALASPAVVAVAFVWLGVGIPCWTIDLLSGGEFHWTQLGTHFGALTVAALGVVRLGMPRGTWWRAMLAHVTLQQVTRLATPRELNINLAFDVFASSKPYFPSYPVYYVVVTAAFSAAFFALERAIPWPRRLAASPKTQ